MPPSVDYASFSFLPCDNEMAVWGVNYLWFTKPPFIITALPQAKNQRSRKLNHRVGNNTKQNKMKKILSILTSILLVTCTLNAQEFKKVTDQDLEKHFLSNQEIQAFTKPIKLDSNTNASKHRPKPRPPIIIFECCGGVIGKVNNAVFDESSGSYTLNTANGKEQLLFITMKGIDENTKQEVSLSMVKNLATNETSVWAEDGSSEFRAIVDSRRAPTFQQTASKASISIASITNCFNKFKKANGPANCSNCFSCLQNCSSKKTRWQRISCSLSNCSTSCWSCVTSVYNFITCVF